MSQAPKPKLNKAWSIGSIENQNLNVTNRDKPNGSARSLEQSSFFDGNSNFAPIIPQRNPLPAQTVPTLRLQASHSRDGNKRTAGKAWQGAQDSQFTEKLRIELAALEHKLIRLHMTSFASPTAVSRGSPPVVSDDGLVFQSEGCAQGDECCNHDGCEAPPLQKGSRAGNLNSLECEDHKPEHMNLAAASFELQKNKTIDASLPSEVKDQDSDDSDDDTYVPESEMCIARGGHEGEEDSSTQGQNESDMREIVRKLRKLSSNISEVNACCRKCGAVYVNDSIYCRSCGSMRPGVCRVCKSIFHQDAEFCRKCGTRRDKAVDGTFIMHDFWHVDNTLRRVHQSEISMSEMSTAGDRASDDLSLWDDDDDDEDDDLIQGESHMEEVFQTFITYPNTLKSIFWETTGGAFIIFDLIVLSMRVFDLPKSKFLSTMTLVSCVYWTVDVPYHFFVGFRNSVGDVEVRPRKVWRRYIRGWFVFDVVLVLIGWVEFAVQTAVDDAAAVPLKFFRLTRALKVCKMIFLARAARNGQPSSTKFSEALEEFGLKSETFPILFGILKIVAALVLVAHLIACAFYSIGRGHSESSDGWTYSPSISHASIQLRYATSFTWSLSQFMGSSEFLEPHNIGERTFKICVMLFCYVVSASIVSSITSSMTRLEIVTAHESRAKAMLQSYLNDNGISRRLRLKVQRNADRIFEEQKRLIPENKIELLGHLSEQLRVDIHYEIYIPIVTLHPFFTKLDKLSPSTMRRICHSSIQRVSLGAGDTLFMEGEAMSHARMYFIRSGSMRYLHENSMDRPIVHGGEWVCEASLWTPWVHFGTLRAKTDCNVLALDGVVFSKIAQSTRTTRSFPRKYAEAYVAQLNQLDPSQHTDLGNPGFDLFDLVMSCDLVSPASMSSRAASKRESRRVSVMSAVGEAIGGAVRGSWFHHKPTMEEAPEDAGAGRKSMTLLHTIRNSFHHR